MANPPRRKDDPTPRVSVPPARSSGSIRPSRAPSAPSLPPAEEQGLDEVERALSLMQGRDPKYERALRETREAAEKHARDVADAEAKATQRAWTRRAIGVAVLLVVAATGAFVVKRVQTKKRLDKALDPLSAKFVAEGFTSVPGSFASLPTSTELDSDGQNCFVVVATEGFALDHGGVTVDGKGSFGFCTCGPEMITAKATPDGAEPSGVRLLRGDNRRVGGIRALPFMKHQPDVVGAGGTECSEDQFDAWLESGHTTSTSTDPPWLAARTKGLPKGAVGFAIVANAASTDPGAIANGAAERCFVAVAEKPSATLRLRWKGGERVVDSAGAYLGWCAKEAASATVLREGGGEVAVLAAPASSTGGVIGLEEIGTRVFGNTMPTWAPPSDLDWSARLSLLASTLSDSQVTTVQMAAFSHASPTTRVVALSVDGPLGSAAFDDDRFHCAPLFDAKARGSVCTEPTHEFFVRIAKVNRGGLAEGALPLWMQAIAGATKTPQSAAVEGRLLALARRLTSEGFVPTFLEAATEHEFGIEIFGRKGEDAVVAVGVASKPPYAFPYTNDAGWSLEDVPAIIPLEEGHVVSLAAKPAPSAPVSERRTVVFRRKK
ncbi:MAG: hypothetical protein U0169_21380 [Polyangiaceae bacterium]